MLSLRRAIIRHQLLCRRATVREGDARPCKRLRRGDRSPDEGSSLYIYPRNGDWGLGGLCHRLSCGGAQALPKSGRGPESLLMLGALSAPMLDILGVRGRCLAESQAHNQSDRFPDQRVQLARFIIVRLGHAEKLVCFPTCGS